MPTCKKGFKVSRNDSHKRCVRIVNSRICLKQGKSYNTKTNKCRIKCTESQERYARRDRPGVTRCRNKCKKHEERGPRYCRRKCSKTQKRVNRKDGKGSRCINN